MKRVRIALAAVFASLLIAASVQAGEGEWIQLFNGKNLDGWKVKIKGFDLGDNYGNTFRVEDGVLKVAYDQYEKFDGKFGHIFYEKPSPSTCYGSNTVSSANRYPVVPAGPSAITAS